MQANDKRTGFSQSLRRTHKHAQLTGIAAKLIDFVQWTDAITAGAIARR